MPIEYYSIFIDLEILRRHLAFQEESSGCIEAADNE